MAEEAVAALERVTVEPTMLRIVVFAGIPGPNTAIPLVSPAGAAAASVMAVERLVVVAPLRLSAPAVLGFSSTLPWPLLVRPPVPVMTLLIVSLSLGESARTISSFKAKSNVPPLMVAVPPPPFRMPALVSVSVVPGFWISPVVKLLPFRFSVGMVRFPCPMISAVICTCMFALVGRMPVVDAPWVAENAASDPTP